MNHEKHRKQFPVATIKDCMMYGHKEGSRVELIDRTGKVRVICSCARCGLLYFGKPHDSAVIVDTP